jgi:hypothetical protein
MQAYSTFSIKDNFYAVNAYKFPQYKAFTAATPAIGTEPGIELGPIMIRAVADLNNDGLDDIIFDSNDVLEKVPTILFSNGDGTFRASAIIIGETQQRTEREIKIVDLNKDGLLDIVCFPAAHTSLVEWANPAVAAQWDANERQIVLINQGSEKFKLQQDIYDIQEGYFHSGEVADINGDGRLDIFPLAEYPSWNLELGGRPRVPLLQNADGSYAYAPSGLPSIFENYRTINIAIGDINQDQINDYAIAVYPYPDQLKLKKVESLPPLMAIAMGSQGKNLDQLNWQFLGKHWVDQATLDKLNAQGARYIDPGAQLVDFIDLDQDGVIEILLSEFIDSGLNMQGGRIALFNWVDGQLKDVTSKFIPFQPANQYETGFVMEKYLADLDGDGQKDLIFSAYFDYSPSNTPYVNDIFIQNKGVFQPALDSTLERRDGVGRPAFLVSGDFNGDGAPDIAGVAGLIEPDPIAGGWLNKNATIVTYLNQIVPPRLSGVKLMGSAGADQLLLKPSESVRGLGGNDQIVGSEDHMETSFYWGISKDYQLSNLSTNRWILNGDKQNEGTDTLVNVDRVSFSDLNIALDLNANAGLVAKTLGVVFGKDAVANKYFVGIGLHFVDALNFSYPSLMELAINARLGANATNAQVVDLLYTNVVGQAPDAATRKTFTDLLDNGTFTVGGLGVLAADTELNKVNINLVGLAQTGLEYTPFSG